MTDPPFAFQISIWGCALFGSDQSNTIAAISERGDAWTELVWDHTAAEIATWQRSVDGGGYGPVPESWALPGVTKLKMREGCDMSGTDGIGSRRDDTEFMSRVRANIERNKPLLDRLARAGDCNACMLTPHGCVEHLDPDAPADE